MTWLLGGNWDLKEREGFLVSECPHPRLSHSIALSILTIFRMASDQRHMQKH